MASVELSRRVEKVVGYPPMCEMSDLPRGASRGQGLRRLGREVAGAILEAGTEPAKLRVVTSDQLAAQDFPRSGDTTSVESSGVRASLHVPRTSTDPPKDWIWRPSCGAAAGSRLN
jgi:hypothetical protein